MVAPGSSQDPVQYIDGQDLARFVVKIAEENIEGTFNLVSSPGTRSIGQVLESSKIITNSDAEFVWLEKVADYALKEWADLPAWVSSTGEARGMAKVSNERAIEAGLEISPLEATINAIWTEIQSEPSREQDDLKAGLKKNREIEILEEYKKKERGTED